jgi:FkbM family methyltransferase
MLTRFAVDLLAFYLRRCPFEGGRWRLIPLALHWAQALPPDSVRDVLTRDGFVMRVRVGDWLGRHVYVRGEYEPATVEVIKALLGPGETFVDVGANAGYFSLLASKCVGPTGRVWAFEPVPITRQELKTNLRLNNAGNVSVGPADHRGTSSLRALQDASETITVQTARLDDLLPAEQKVNVIKIDIEAAEQMALEGMRGRLERDHPDLIIEVTDPYLRPMGHTAVGLCEMLHRLGYRMFVIENRALVPFDPCDAATWSQYNALFTTRQELPGRLQTLLPEKVARTGRKQPCAYST